MPIWCCRLAPVHSKLILVAMLAGSCIVCVFCVRVHVWMLTLTSCQAISGYPLFPFKSHSIIRGCHAAPSIDSQLAYRALHYNMTHMKSIIVFTNKRN